MLEAGCRTLVFSSTCAIYGEPAEIPIGETTPQNPVNPYGASKAMVERILSDYQRAHEMRAIALRYFNASGADPDSELGELRDPETHLIPRAMMAIQGHIHDFAVFGPTIQRPTAPPSETIFTSRILPRLTSRRCNICLLAKPAAPSILAPATVIP